MLASLGWDLELNTDTGRLPKVLAQLPDALPPFINPIDKPEAALSGLGHYLQVLRQINPQNLSSRKLPLASTRKFGVAGLGFVSKKPMDLHVFLMANRLSNVTSMALAVFRSITLQTSYTSFQPPSALQPWDL